MNDEPTLFVSTREAWRAWLEEHHASATAVWLIMLKKGVREPGLSLDEAVEEALCFGWIDGRLRRIDDRSHKLRFSPRRPDSVWSRTNKARVERLVASGRMTEAGMAVVSAAKQSGRWDAGSDERLDRTPSELEDALAGCPEAETRWSAWPPSRRRQYVYWILQAKKPETRARRVADTVRQAAEECRPRGNV